MNNVFLSNISVYFQAALKHYLLLLPTFFIIIIELIRVGKSSIGLRYNRYLVWISS